MANGQMGTWEREKGIKIGKQEPAEKRQATGQRSRRKDRRTGQREWMHGQTVQTEKMDGEVEAEDEEKNRHIHVYSFRNEEIQRQHQ